MAFKIFSSCLQFPNSERGSKGGRGGRILSSFSKKERRMWVRPVLSVTNERPRILRKRGSAVPATVPGNATRKLSGVERRGQQVRSQWPQAAKFHDFRRDLGSKQGANPSLASDPLHVTTLVAVVYCS